MKSILKFRFLSVLFLAGWVSGPACSDAQAQSGVDAALSVPPPAGKPWEATWGFWPKATPDAWQQTHWGFVSKARQGPVDILFMGDSLTKGWAGAGKEIWEQTYKPLNALNIGIGGDTTRQTLWRIEHEAFGGSQPKVVVLMIGVNNIFTATGTDDEIAKGIQEILEQIQLKSPSSQILLLSIVPLGNESQSARARQINTALAGFASDRIRFLDLTSKFQDAGGKVIPELYTADLVHLAQPGYAAWNEAMKPVLEEMLK